jgi:hypothetical protein
MNDEPMMRTCEGRLVPAKFVKPERRLEDQLVTGLLAKAETLRAAIVAFKSDVLDEIDTFKSLVAEQYGVKLGGRRDGITLTSFDLMTKVQVSIANTMTFGPELIAAKELIDQCLTDWSDGADDRLRLIVMSAFEVGEGRSLRVDRVLELRKLNITDPKWVRAMQAINDALTVARSKQYVRIYRRPNADAPWQQIVLDVSRA